MERVTAPVPATTLPIPIEGKPLLKAKNSVPIITSIKEIRPTLKEPNRSESKPTKIAKKMDGNVNRLISKPASAWANLNSAIIKVRMGGKDCNVKANTNIQM
jgi:hypothetical protein